jgi:hypothetical protein
VIAREESDMQDLPTAAELVEAVREFLERDVFPELAGRRRFHTRVAMNVLGIVQRELTLGGEADARERERLARLLPPSDTADRSLGDLNAQLAGAIRDATLAAPRAELIAHLRETLHDKLAIANPRYIAD